MFDVSFGELLLILIVGLLVFGPEKLPQVVRTASLWMAKLRRSFNDIRTEIEREVGVDDIKREIHNQSILDSLRDVKNDLQGAQQQLRQLPYEVSDSVRENFRREAIEHDPVHQPVPTAHVIPDDDFQHNETQHNDQPSVDAPPVAAPTAENSTASAAENNVAPTKQPHHS